MRSKINSIVGPHEHLLATVKRQKLAWFGHVTRHDSLPQTILQSTLEEGGGDAVVGRVTWVRLKQPQEQRYPFLTVLAVLSCVQTKRIFNVHTDVNARDRHLHGSGMSHATTACPKPSFGAPWAVRTPYKRVCTEN